MTLFVRVVDHLRTLDIPFAVIGASAMAAHGVSRSTLDIDLLTTDVRVLDDQIWRTESVTSDIRRGASDDPLAGVVRVTAAGERDVDIVVGRTRWQAALLTSAYNIDQLLAAGDRATLVERSEQIAGNNS